MKKHRLFVAIFTSLALAGWSQDNAVIVESYTDGINSDSFSKPEGKWTESTAKSAAPGLTATKSVFNDANADPATARFTPNLPADGKYEVFITYPTSGNASDIKYTIATADGEQHLLITQNGRVLGATPAADKWYSLGVYNFKAGNSGYVELSDPLTGDHPLANEPNARIYADAVKFVPADPGAAVTALNADFPAPAATAANNTPAPLPGSAAIAEAAAQTPATTPAASADTAPALPSLPAEVASATPNLPSLPGNNEQNAAAALPGLPSGTPASDASNLPGLPAAPAAPNLPSLPAGQSNATEALPAIPTPAPVAENLPSLAPVTPTPVRELPSPSDTPAPSAEMPLPALPAAVPSPGAGLAVPTPFSSSATELPAQPTVASAAAPSDYSITTYNPSGLQWMYDIGSAMAAARSQNKKVLVFFTAEHNRAAQAYETESFKDPVVRQALSKYVLVKVDFPKSTRLAYSMGVFGAGVIAVVDPSAAVTSRVVQRPASASELITQLASTHALRATPTPGVQNGAAPSASTPAPQADASQNSTTADAAITSGVAPMPGDVAPAPMPGSTPAPMPATAPAPMPGAAPAPMPGMPAAAPAAPAVPAAPATGDAASNLPGLPPQ